MWYNDACGTLLIGKRWSLLVVRELMFGPLRFAALRANLPGISAKVLTERLERLEAANVLAKRVVPPSDWGYVPEPLIQELGGWSAGPREAPSTVPPCRYRTPASCSHCAP